MKICGSTSIEKVKPGSIINFKDHQLIENNVLVIKFDKFGIVEKKNFLIKMI